MVNHVHKTVLWLFVAVLADSLVAVVLRVGSVEAFLHGDHSWTNLVALGGLCALALLVVVTLRTARDLLSMCQHVTVTDSRVAVLEATALAAQSHGMTGAAPVPAAFGRDVSSARTRMLDLLDRATLTIALQPIIDIQRDRWAAVEALARFPDGRGPDAWFREAAELGLGVELELLAINAALGRVPDLPQDVGISLNASPSLILDPRLAEAIYASGIELDRVTVEITEHAAVTEYDEITSALLLLRERGVLLAVDDTGAGFASFSHVLKLRPDIIKLDRSMVVDIADDPARRAFVTAVVLLALELNASITAEGVETYDELETLVALGVDHAQGYYLARPDTMRSTWESWASRRWLAPPGIGTGAGAAPLLAERSA
jgi:EAL domain-containing protein (putative c-di-GMP-specific phosphodiesterase class I)